MSSKLDLLMDEVMEPFDDFDLNGGESDLLEGHYRKEKMESEKKFSYLLLFILLLFAICS